MIKTDIDGIHVAQPGVLINTMQDSSYMAQKRRMIDEAHQKERINNIEKDVTDIKQMLSAILTKVS